MCIIIIKKQGVELPKQEWLDNSERTNRDGIGVCYKKADRSEVVIKKDFVNATTLGVWLKDNIVKEDDLIIHFRFATHGIKDVGNRHPFPISKDKKLLREANLVCRMALTHNGVISQHSGHQKFSDTQKFVLGIMSDDAVKNNLNSPAIRKMIGDYIGSDKLAILDNEGTVYLWGEFIREEGLLFSNSGYKATERVIQYNWWNSATPEGHYGECDGCKDKTHVKVTEIKQGNTNMLLDLCKKCRKKARKAKLSINGLNVRVVEDEGAENEPAIQKCSSCFEEYETKAMVDSSWGKMCRKCAIQMQDY